MLEDLIYQFAIRTGLVNPKYNEAFRGVYVWEYAKKRSVKSQTRPRILRSLLIICYQASLLFLLFFILFFAAWMERAKVGRRAKKNRKKDRLIAGLLVPEKGQTHLKATKNQKQNRFQPEKLHSFALWQILIRTNFSLLIKIGWENNAYFKARGFTTDLQLNKCSWHKNKGIKKTNKARDSKERKKERKKEKE